MNFQIRKIILWPRNQAFHPRVVQFESGSVNIISGISRTGKSAIIPIIDYCLGADKCTIPVNTIRKSCSWFGVVVETIQGEKLFARREPGIQKSTGDMFILEDQHVDIPTSISEKNATVDAAKRILDELSGLTALDFDFENLGSGFKGRPSFRDLAAFIFQPQNIVANPNVLFYKTDSHEHREKLRTIFPYVLGVLNPELLAKYHELSQLRKTLRRKQTELTNLKQVSDRWLAEIRARTVEASELGLLQDLPRQEASRDEMVDLLRSVVGAQSDELKINSETISEALQELDNLNKEERRLSLEISTLRKRQSEMSALREGAALYKGALQIQRDRLKISRWIQEKSDGSHACPICNNPIDSTAITNELTRSLRQIETEAGEFESVPASFDREFERVRSGTELLAEKLNAVRIRRNSLQQLSDEVKKSQFDSLRVSRFVGSVEQALQTYDQLGTDSELTEEITELIDRVKRLNETLDESAIKQNQNRALMTISLYAGRLLPNLDVERPNDPVELSLTDLTVKVNGIERGDYLWEIGSGSNWLAYHIAMSLALHQFFLDQPATPIPSFIIYDQPSQVYFPKHLREDVENPNDLSKWDDEDVEALRQVFKVLSDFSTLNPNRFQIIVLDHAPDYLWRDLPNTNAPEEWRGGVTLVPKEWL
jgi:hypothetical protein